MTGVSMTGIIMQNANMRDQEGRAKREENV